MAELWGDETRKAVDNFPVSGEPIPASVIHWLGRIKAAAARVNADLGLLDAEHGRARSRRLPTRSPHGDHDDQFPVDVFQTGSGTSSNMNANEVIAALAGGGAHPNDHVNLGQSSNDVFPSAVHLAALDAITNELLPSLELLACGTGGEGRRVRRRREGRTHTPDGRRPGHARPGVRRVRGADPPGPRPGQRRPPAPRARSRSAARRSAPGSTPTRSSRPGSARSSPRRPASTSARPPTRSRRRRTATALVETSGALKVVAVSLTKIANDLRWMSSGPRTGLGEIVLPELQKGSSIMPGKVNPVIPEVVVQVAAQVIGNDVAITRRRDAGQLRAQRDGADAGPQPAAVDPPARRRRRGCSPSGASTASKPTSTRATRHAENTLATATALNPYIGYDAAAVIVKDAAASGRPLREVAHDHGVSDEVLDEALDLHRMTGGG